MINIYMLRVQIVLDIEANGIWLISRMASDALSVAFGDQSQLNWSISWRSPPSAKNMDGWNGTLTSQVVLLEYVTAQINWDPKLR